MPSQSEDDLKTNSPEGQSLALKLGNMAKIEYWNISWWVAVAFTLGSVVWVVNGFAGFLPFCNSHFQTAAHSTGWTAFIGATIFEFGSIFGMWEAWNQSTTAQFGGAVEKTLHDLENGGGQRNSEGNGQDRGSLDNEKLSQKWIWFSVDRKYWHEMGFHAAFWQWCAATIFWISGFTAIPTIQNAIQENTGLLNGVFWTPQVIGGSGFIVSSTFIMLAAQEKWYRPEPLSLAWHVGLWNFIGGVGFTLCGALGYGAATNHRVAYQSALSTFWGGWAFLIGSVIQWYESVN